MKFTLCISSESQSPISGSLLGPQSLCGHPSPSLSMPTLHPGPRALTERCWNSHALMMLVATLGKIPLFLFRRRSWSSSSSSPPELGEATLVSSPSPEGGQASCVCGQQAGRSEGPRTLTQETNPHPYYPCTSGSPTCCLTSILRLTPTFPLHLPGFLPWSLELSPLWEARPPLDGPGVPKCTDPLSSWSLIHVLFWKTRAKISARPGCPIAQ